LGTIRSEYSIEQFEIALQRFAHQLPSMIQRIDEIHVRSENMVVDLEFNHGVKGEITKISVYFYKSDKPDSWGELLTFTVEPKNYIDSPHVTKIHYEGASDKQYNEKILACLKRLMSDMKPQPRFRLKNMGSFPRRLDSYINPRNAKTRKRKT